MKKSSKAIRFAIPSGHKLQKKKNKHEVKNNTKQSISETQFTVQIILNAKTNNVLTLKFEGYRPLSEVRQVLYEKVNKYHESIGMVVGFCTHDLNYAYDYKFQTGTGFLDRNLKFTCMVYENQRGLQKYKICCCLAIGGFSKVFLVRSKISGQFFAAKFIDRSKKHLLNQSLIMNEKQISMKLDSPFLVKTYQFLENNQFYVFILEYCSGGELFYLLKQIKCMQQDDARIYFIQILLGIEHLHKAGFMYRDLKPENILLDSKGYLKIADFGLSKQFSTRSFSFCGSIQYMAPEIIRGNGHKQFVDYYCLGALLYQMLIGHPPFYDSRCTQQQTKAKILFDSVEFPKDMISQCAMDFIKKLTKKNQRQRLGYYGGCKQIMSHPWVGKINRKMFQQKQFMSPYPVNLNSLNFDPEQIGQSERLFQNKVNLVVAAALRKSSKPQTFQHLKQNLKKQKSMSQKVFRNQSLSLNKCKSLVVKNNKKVKSPYYSILKPIKATSKTKLHKISTQGDQTLTKNNFDAYNRWAQSLVGQKTKKMQGGSKLQKKCKYVPFLTTIEANCSPQKTLAQKLALKS